MEELREKVAHLEEREKSNTHRIDSLDAKVEDIHELASSVKVIASEMKAMRSDLNSIDNRVKTVEEKPAKKWEDLIKTVLTCVATAIAGFLLAKFGL